MSHNFPNANEIMAAWHKKMEEILQDATLQSSIQEQWAQLYQNIQANYVSANQYHDLLHAQRALENKLAALEARITLLERVLSGN